jgi:hypothetical protein
MAQQLRERIDKWDYMKLKSFWTTKDMATRFSHRMGENLFQLYSWQGINNKNTQRAQNTKLPPKINDQIKKWANELNRTFSKEEVQMTKKHKKKCSPSLAIEEMQIKTTVRFYLIHVRIAIIKSTINHKCWQGCGGKGTLIHCWWESKLV